jgi:hypothetical protein
MTQKHLSLIFEHFHDSNFWSLEKQIAKLNSLDNMILINLKLMLSKYKNERGIFGVHLGADKYNPALSSF